jgi:hypothetical protein
MLWEVYRSKKSVCMKIYNYMSVYLWCCATFNFFEAGNMLTELAKILLLISEYVSQFHINVLV